MEEAYNELYQQFVCLRSLCLRQAALLQQLATALQKQQGASVSTADLNDLTSSPVQCTHEMPVYPCVKPQPATAKTQNLAEQCGVDHLSRNMGTFSDLLAKDMSKLNVDTPHQRKEDVKVEHKTPFLLTLDSLRYRGASFNESNHPGQSQPPGDRSLYTRRMPVTDSPSLGGDFLFQSDGALMSDVVLQSHVCEFCQAVFPGDTTTRGEFLRHLCTHVT